jgi:hypothetical protein
MSDWWTRHELRRVADELRRARVDREDPDGTHRVRGYLAVIFILALFIVPKTLEIADKKQATRNEMRKWSQLPKEQRDASIKEAAIRIHADYKETLEKICIANETRWKHSEINCSYIKEDFIRNFCSPTHLFKDVSDPTMCEKLKKTSNNW